MKNPVSIQPMPVYQAIATALDALRRCEQTDNTEWETRWRERIQQIVDDCLPSGSGIDKGTRFAFDLSTPNRLVFRCDYHHMNDGGYYDGWTAYGVIVTPSLVSGIALRITGQDRNDTKEYLHEVYHSALTEMLEANPHEPQTAVNS